VATHRDWLDFDVKRLVGNVPPIQIRLRGEMEFRLTLLNVLCEHENYIQKLRKDIELEHLRLEKQEQVDKLEIQNMINENHRIYQEIQGIKDKISTLETKKDNLSNSYNSLVQKVTKTSFSPAIPNSQGDPFVIDSQDRDDDPIPLMPNPPIKSFEQNLPIKDVKQVTEVPAHDPVTEKLKLVAGWSMPKLIKFPSPTTAFVEPQDKKPQKADFDFHFERRESEPTTPKKRKSPTKPVVIPSPKKDKKSLEILPPNKKTAVVQTKVPSVVPYSIDLGALTEVTQLDKPNEVQKSTLEIKPMYIVKKELESAKKNVNDPKKSECNECMRFYETMFPDPVERQKVIDKTSRHTCKHKSDTPEGFWDLGSFIETDVQEKENSLTY
jgi:hypothetical protein